MFTPHVDIHRHLEAAPDLDDLPDFIRKHNVDLPSNLNTLRSIIQFQSYPGDLDTFLEPFMEHIYKLFPTEEAVSDFTLLSIQKMAREGLRYGELRFSPRYMGAHYTPSPVLSSESVINGVIDGKNRAAQMFPLLRTELILILPRELGPEMSEEIVKLAIKYRGEICGIDLAGSEKLGPPLPFKDLFAEAHAEGIPATVHAGEAGPAENVRIAIEKLFARRIGHGVAAIKDDEITAMLRDTGVTLEMCLHSNWLTGAIEGSPENHPLMNFSQSGVNATINTDDPMIQNTWMWNEFEQALVLGATKADLVTFQTNALNSAFISDVDRAHLITQFRQYLLS